MPVQGLKNLEPVGKSVAEEPQIVSICELHYFDGLATVAIA
jgi:hypothetical protein